MVFRLKDAPELNEALEERLAGTESVGCGTAIKSITVGTPAASRNGQGAQRVAGPRVGSFARRQSRMTKGTLLYQAAR